MSTHQICEPSPSKLQLRTNPGSRHTGVAVTRDYSDDSRDVLIALVINHRGRSIKLAMTKRAQNRRNRRQRKTHYRQPRFSNRTRQPDWLPPSLLSRLQNTLTWVRRLSSMLPIAKVHVETTVFDPQLLRDPEMQGKEYQQGPLYQTNLRAAVLHRDNRKCVYCGKSGQRNRLELDHAVPKSHGGADRYDNLLTACHDCNHRRGNQPLETWLKTPSQEAGRSAGRDWAKTLSDATHLNIILPRLLEELRQDGWSVHTHSARIDRRWPAAVRSGEVPAYRRRRNRLSKGITSHTRRASSRQRQGARQPPAHHARPERHAEGQALPAILPATQAYPAKNADASA